MKQFIIIIMSDSGDPYNVGSIYGTEEEAEKESMDAAEDAAKIQGAGTPSDSKVLETSMPVQGGGASSSSYFNWRQNTQGY